MDGLDPRTVTRLLNHAAEGDGSSAAELLPLVYDQLRQLAASYFRDERVGHTLEPTALVHEAFVRLVGTTEIEWQSKAQFFTIASRAMRNALIDHARAKKRLKRGGDGHRLTLIGNEAASIGTDPIDLMALDESLTALAHLDQRKAALVELRFFAGLTSDEAADILQIARSTASQDWRFARAWLLNQLGQEN